MRRVLRSCSFALLIGVFVASCGSTTPSAPSPAATSSPPAQIPGLLGHWTGGGGTRYADPATGREWGYGCERSVQVNAQQGADLSGSIASSGSGASNDRYCGYGSGFTAHVAGDAFTMSTKTPPSGSGSCGGLQRHEACCSQLSGGEVATGLLTDDSHMKGSATLRGSCEDPLGNPFEGEVTVEFAVTRITSQP